MTWTQTDFNRFRTKYPILSFADKKNVYQELYEVFPQQTHCLHDLPFLLNILPKQLNIKVAEYGGYDGFLAAIILYHNPTWTWMNFELIPHKPHWFTQDKNYREIVLEKEIWQSNIVLDCDVFFADNTIEHLSDGEFKDFVGWLKTQKCQTIILGSPLEEDGQTWWGYFGAHVLTLGTRQVTKLMQPEYRLVSEKRDKVGWMARFDYHS